MTQPYVYRLTDKMTGKRYIGARFAKGCEPSDLGVSYFTSSVSVKTLFKTEPARFEKQIVVTGDANYVRKVEKNLLDFYDCVNSDEFYNRTNNKSIHSEDALRGSKKAHSVRDSNGKSVLALSVGKKNVESGWAAELGKRAVASGNLPLMAARAGRIGGKIGGKISAVKLNSEKWVCATCGLTTNKGPLGRHQKLSDHEGKFIFK